MIPGGDSYSTVAKILSRNQGNERVSLLSLMIEIHSFVLCVSFEPWRNEVLHGLNWMAVAKRTMVSSFCGLLYRQVVARRPASQSVVRCVQLEPDE